MNPFFLSRQCVSLMKVLQKFNEILERVSLYR